MVKADLKSSICKCYLNFFQKSHAQNLQWGLRGQSVQLSEKYSHGDMICLFSRIQLCKGGYDDWPVKVLVHLSLYAEHVCFSTCYAATLPFNSLAFSPPHPTDVFCGSSVVQTTVGGPPQARTQSKCRFKNSSDCLANRWMLWKPHYACVGVLHSIHHLQVRIWLQIRINLLAKYKLSFLFTFSNCNNLKAFMFQQPYHRKLYR